MVKSQTVGQGRAGGRGRILLSCVAALTFVASSVTWACRASNGAPGGPPSSGGAANASATAAPRTPADTVQTTIGPSGFAPRQVSHAAGPFKLKVKNRSGEAEVTLRLSDAEGRKVTEAKLTNKVREWTMPVELAAGTYTLAEVNHASWTCAVVVTAQR